MLAFGRRRYRGQAGVSKPSGRFLLSGPTLDRVGERKPTPGRFPIPLGQQECGHVESFEEAVSLSLAERHAGGGKHGYGDYPRPLLWQQTATRGRPPPDG